MEPTPGYTRASAYVAERLVRGSWTEADREELSSALDSMNDRERREIMGSVIRASNEGSLRVETNGPLF